MPLPLRYVLVPLAAMLCIGCGDGRPARVPVAGRVVIDGQPVPSGLIKLVNPTTRAAIGTLDPDGRFQLSCYEAHDGVIRGTHYVEITATESIDQRTRRWHAPKKYATKETSGIEVTIDEPTDDLLVELTWDGAKGPFVERQ